jgi:hypothetical protein
MKESKGAEGSARKFATCGKAHDQQRGNNQLQQRPAPESKRCSQPAKEKMSAFMDWKMNVIEQRELSPVGGEIEKQQDVKDGPANPLRARDGLPFNFRKLPVNLRTLHAAYGYHRASAGGEAFTVAGITLGFPLKY